jgi:hypothetical protein
VGLFDGTSIFLMATISLETNNDFHILLSKFVFISGSLAFLVETFFLGAWRKYIYKSWTEYPLSFKFRKISSAIIPIVGLTFLYLFIEKDNGPIVNPYVTQIFYILNEHVLATMHFSYALFWLPEMLRHFHPEPSTEIIG